MSDKTIKRTIRVLQEDIDNGDRLNVQSCMVARAALHDLDFLEPGWTVDVDYNGGEKKFGGHIKVLDNNYELRFKAVLDKETATKIFDWDKMAYGPNHSSSRRHSVAAPSPEEVSDLDYEEELLEAQMELADDLEQLIVRRLNA